ncbi:MAG: hypothetical protein JWO99_581 [Candidatus Saccharibacteria bacterium]|nr:hypothetical protein [Candidatus Saccharibacteria bacterium]
MVAKKTTAKKPAKKTTHKRVASKKSSRMKSFKLYKDDKPFTTFRITKQTVYWSILLIFIIITQLWILKVQLDISNLTNALLSN